MTDQPIQPRGFQPKDLKNTLGRRPTPAPTPSPDPPLAPVPETQPSPGSHLELSAQPAAASNLARPGAVREPPPASPRRRPHTVFYLPLDLSNDLREFARSRNKTNADVIFDALESTLEELPQLMRPSDGGEATDGTQGMFTRVPAKPVGQKVQISGRIQDDNLAVIDQLVKQHGAESRSHLVEVALRAYLSTHTPVPSR